MTATYNPELPTDKDWVRFLTGDRELTEAPGFSMERPILQDEEITALLSEESNKYLASARAGDLILSRTKGMVSKALDGLSISFGDSPESTYREYLKRLRIKGCDNLLTNRKHFRVL